MLSFTENLMTYALGRRVEYYDMPTIRAIVRDAAKNDYRMSSFVLGRRQQPGVPDERSAEAPSRRRSTAVAERQPDPRTGP